MHDNLVFNVGDRVIANDQIDRFQVPYPMTGTVITSLTNSAAGAMVGIRWDNVPEWRGGSYSFNTVGVPNSRYAFTREIEHVQTYVQLELDL